MTRFSPILGLTLLTSVCSAPAQQSAGHAYEEAVKAFESGDSIAVVKLLEPVVQSCAVKGSDLGRVQGLLAASYHAVGQFRSAAAAYDNAIALLENDPRAIKDYEAVLRESGDLYRELGDLSSAERLEEKSLQLSLASQDPAAIARASEGLAEIFLDRGEFRKGEWFVSRATAEAQLAQLKGWVALKRKDTQTAVENYQHAINLFAGRYGDNFALTGWAYMLLASAYEQQKSWDKAFESAQKGMTILRQTVGTRDTRYASAEIRFAKMLAKTGQHSAADKMKNDAEETMLKAQQSQCVGCTIDVAAFR